MASDAPLGLVLTQEIRSQGCISFARFMELCLYDPRRGYYNRPSFALGKEGDFYTNAHLGAVWARLLARHFSAIWEELGKPERFDLVELGPGDGELAAELLPWLSRHDAELGSHLHYTAIEQSAALRERLGQLLSPFGERVRVLPELPSEQSGSVTGCVLANEFFDALPFQILRRQDRQWQESCVCLNADGTLGWRQEPVRSSAGVAEAERCCGSNPRRDADDECVAEICALAEEWMKGIGQWLGRGEVLVVDYGYTREQWQAGRFPQGSAVAYRRHRVVEDLLANTGEQDITAHVNFSQLMDSGAAGGLQFRQLIAQEQFLMQLGQRDQFQELFADCASEDERQQRRLQLKSLLLPQAMGGTFQVLEMTKGQQ